MEHPTRQSPSPIRRWTLRIALAVWAVTVLTGGAALMVGHWVTLPVPAVDDARLAEGVASVAEDGQWTVLHVMYAKCGCSKRIFEHLADSERPEGLRERVILVDRDPAFEPKLLQNGFDLERVTHDELVNKYNIKGAPLMVVADPSGTVRYVGGYTDRKRGPNIRDIDIIQRLQRGDSVGELPLFGCAVSQSLQELLDPMGLKY